VPINPAAMQIRGSVPIMLLLQQLKMLVFNWRRD